MKIHWATNWPCVCVRIDGGGMCGALGPSAHSHDGGGTSIWLEANVDNVQRLFYHQNQIIIMSCGLTQYCRIIIIMAYHSVWWWWWEKSQYGQRCICFNKIYWLLENLNRLLNVNSLQCHCQPAEIENLIYEDNQMPYKLDMESAGWTVRALNVMASILMGLWWTVSSYIPSEKWIAYLASTLHWLTSLKIINFFPKRHSTFFSTWNDFAVFFAGFFPWLLYVEALAYSSLSARLVFIVNFSSAGEEDMNMHFEKKKKTDNMITYFSVGLYM